MSERSSRVMPEAFDDLEQGIILHDPETGEILDVNQGLVDLYRYSADEFRSMDVGDFTADSFDYTQAEAEHRIRRAAAGEEQSFKWYVRVATGELLWVNVTLRRTTIEGSDLVLAVVRDITEYKERERRLRILYRVLRHNLRNEMTIVLGYADQLVDAVDRDELERKAEIIHDTAETVADLSDSVEELQAIAGRDATDRGPVDLGALLADLVDDFQTVHPDAVFDVSPADTVVVGDEGLRNAIENVVDNAVVHNDQPSPHVKISVEEDYAPNQVRLVVADDGPGIPQVELDVLSEQKDITSLQHGSGLGLWVAKWCVESLGGQLVIEENEARGSSVGLVLPQWQVSD
ncbi:ATP-binding protein [Haloarchaeobius sp. DT45]|uniref:PAS domain-containing sensor histidine kinase n=1 Tax=Haloarchaeobius sp. DT45 TaxID=3446116 RepID=UPI003F6C2A16